MPAGTWVTEGMLKKEWQKGCYGHRGGSLALAVRRVFQFAIKRAPLSHCCAAGSIEQAHVQLALERRNRVADRCLDDVTHLSRASESAHLRDGDKIFELANFHALQPLPQMTSE